ncbi:hypothetical protein L1987_76949 [Smallanthus sonchifolius]|uniref:Uncharacterized protein n=1 Tax=Smallanthus sonchifolius TaxID=185202 RepID=A0ACB8Z878_9ASTR|nr:hypothetical protein L1987_76949 [Smallanthus sonchifolius]
MVKGGVFFVFVVGNFWAMILLTRSNLSHESSMNQHHNWLPLFVFINEEKDELGLNKMQSSHQDIIIRKWQDKNIMSNVTT